MAQARLVFRKDDAAPQGYEWPRGYPFGVGAFLYAADATQFSGPIASFAVDPLQPLPRTAPGSVVSVDGPITQWSRSVVVAADDTEVIPASGYRVFGDGKTSPMLVERGDVVAHPAAVNWEASWRYPLGSRRHREQYGSDVRRHLAFAHLGLVWFVVVMSLALVALGGSIVAGDGDRAYPVFRFALATVLGSLGLIGTYRYLVPRGRGLRAPRRRSTVSTTRASMHFRWCAGYGEGPIAVATISDVDGEPPGTYEVIGVPDRFDPVEDIQVVVERAEGRELPISITAGEMSLTPITRLR